MHKGKLAESNFASLSDMMAAYAEEAVRVAWADHRRRLDLSESSVEVLEQILDGQSAEELEFQTRLWGSYFGEVIRGRYAGEWELAAESRRRGCCCAYPRGARCAAIPTHQGLSSPDSGPGRKPSRLLQNGLEPPRQSIQIAPPGRTMIGHARAVTGTCLLCDNRESGEIPWANYSHLLTLLSFWWSHS